MYTTTTAKRLTLTPADETLTKEQIALAPAPPANQVGVHFRRSEFALLWFQLH